MKKKNLNQKIIYFILCIIFIFVIFVSVKKIYLRHNENKSEKEKVAEQERIANSRIVKKYILEKDDGWYYAISSEGIAIEEGNYTYSNSIGGCNIKHINLEDNYVVFIDEQNPENNYSIPASPPDLVTSYKSKNGKKTENEELKEINNLLREKKWNRKITAEDLSSIDFVNFDKLDIVTLWNNAYELEYNNDFGSYGALSYCHIEKENKEKNYFQVGVLLDYGKISRIRIDYYYGDGIYLSDLIENKKANQEQIVLYEKIRDIEEEIEDDGSFELKNKFDDLRKNPKYIELFKLFEKLESYRNK